MARGRIRDAGWNYSCKIVVPWGEVRIGRTGENTVKVLLKTLLLTLALGAFGEPYRPHLFFDGAALASILAQQLESEYSPRQLRSQSVSALPMLRLLMHGHAIYTDHKERMGKLHSWVMSQPDGSILPREFYARAITLSDGKVQEGLILAWNFLRDGWNQSGNRNSYPHIVKLYDITGEASRFQGNDQFVSDPKDSKRRLFVKTIRGDNFSAWYHVAGTALLGFTLANSSLPLPARLLTSIPIWIEENLHYDEFIDPVKRRLLDYQGMELGLGLANHFRGFRRSVIRDYLYDAPEKFPPTWALREGESATDYYRRCPRNLAFMAMKRTFGPALGPAVILVTGGAAAAGLSPYIRKPAVAK